MAGTWGATGSDEFREFADDLETVAARIPRDVLEPAMEDTAEELIDQILHNLDVAATSKGGTYDSRTSPYEPGGENDSSDDGFHITERDAWTVEIDNIGGSKGILVQPKLAVKDRAYWIEKGTPDHGPDGDTPMYFYANGHLVVMAEKPKRSSPFYGPYIEQASSDDVDGAQFNFGEPTEVDGLDPLNYFENAVRALSSRRTFSKNINKHWKKVLQEQGFEA